MFFKTKFINLAYVFNKNQFKVRNELIHTKKGSIKIECSYWASSL